MPRKNELYDIAVVILAETDKAYRVDHGDKEPCWVPKSQCELDHNVLTLPVWLAREKGMI